MKAVDLDAFRNGIREHVNKRVGEDVLHDVLIEQIDFLSKQDIRDNAIRRKAAKPKAAAEKKAASPDSDH